MVWEFWKHHSPRNLDWPIVYSWQNLPLVLTRYARRQGESVRFDYAPCDSFWVTFSSVLVIALLVQWIDGGLSRLQVVDMLVFFCVGANRTKFHEGMTFINCTYLILIDSAWMAFLREVWGFVWLVVSNFIIDLLISSLNDVILVTRLWKLVLFAGLLTLDPPNKYF